MENKDRYYKAEMDVITAVALLLEGITNEEERIARTRAASKAISDLYDTVRGLV